MSKPDRRPAHEHAPHLLTAAATLTGTCLAAAGIFRIEQQQRGSEIWADNLAALSGLLYLVATVLAYISVRDQRSDLHRVTEALFWVASVVLAVLLLGLALETIVV